MTAAWSATDDDTASLLSVLADDGTVSADHEWRLFLAALRDAAESDGRISPNTLRPLLRGRVKASRVGAFTRRALLADVVAYTGGYEISDDLASRNAGKPARVMRLLDTTTTKEN